MTLEQMDEIHTKDFVDCMLPGVIKSKSVYYISGNSFKSVWSLKFVINE